MNLLEVRVVSICFSEPTGTQVAGSELNFSMKEGEILGIVGESGSGKCLTALSIM